MRPGGLTALSIFNFVFGGFAVLGSLLNLALLSAVYAALEKVAHRSGQELPAMGVFYFLYGFAAFRGALLITSGIGYLGMRKFLGRTLGNVYAVLAIASIVLEIEVAPIGFSVANLVEFAYPLITLFLLNAVFRKDFAR